MLLPFLCALGIHASGIDSSFPILDIVDVDTSKWPAPSRDGLYLGDIRAVLNISSTVNKEPTTAQIFWRRRDANPSVKAVVVTDSDGNWIPAETSAVEAGCGVVSFRPSAGAGIYYAYYLPHFQTGGDAHIHFHWYNCTEHNRTCVLESGAGACDTVDPDASRPVVRLETRINEDFPFPGMGFSPMEFTALPSEIANLAGSATSPSDTPALPQVFLEPRENILRMFTNRVPALWAQAGERHSIELSGLAGEWLTFQVGLFASRGSANNLTFAFDPSGPFAGSASSCLNLGGIGPAGEPFKRAYSLAPGRVGALWVGVQLPGEAGTLSSTAVLGVAGVEETVTVTVSVNVTMPASGAPLSDGGDSDPYRLSRLRWLDSTVGIDHSVPAPFAPLSVSNNIEQTLPNGGFSVKLVNKRVEVQESGLLSSIQVDTTYQRGGNNATDTREVLDVSEAPFEFQLWDAKSNAPLILSVVESAQVLSSEADSVTWGAVLEAPDARARVTINGSLDFDSYMSFSAEIEAASDAPPLELGDVRLVARAAAPGYVVGFGTSGSLIHDLEWHWNNATGDNMVWTGAVEAGVFIKLKGSGDEWNNPLYSKDEPEIPFIPKSWGGSNATNLSPSAGANLTMSNASDASTQVVTVTAYSGPRTLAPGEKISFLFDVAATPSKPLDAPAHFAQRYVQVGYGTPYMSPQEVAAGNATVVTLHQGIPGVVNSTMVNPYINWPFVPTVVDFLENYTSQGRDLGMQVKFYYTIRELTNHAAELFPLLSLQGEIFTDEDPYTIPQKGYCQDWDCHGGGAWLHQHVEDDYVFCWQQTLSNGEWDEALCDIGTSRWFNYYLVGLNRSVADAPHIGGVYYDGINFDRLGMRRVRRVLDAAAAQAGATNPLIDIHTGYSRMSPPSVAYLSHYAYADSLWNGEGFDWGSGPSYYLVDFSGLPHGVFVDRLGHGDGGVHFKALLFGAYTRNTAQSHAIWQLWDQVDIEKSQMFGFWGASDSAGRPVMNLTIGGKPTPAPAPKSCAGQYDPVMHGQYPENSGGAAGDIGFGGGCGPGTEPAYPPLTVDEALQTCCDLGDECAGFSITRDLDAKGRGHGCFKKNAAGGTTKNKEFDGYKKTAAPGSECTSKVTDSSGSVLATAFVSYGRRTTVVVASWCSLDANVTVNYDWEALGLDSSSVTARAPEIDGIQQEADLGDGTTLRVAAGQGVVFVIEPKGDASV